MTLRRKTLLIIGVTLVSLIGVLYSTSSTILLGGFAKLEEQDSRQNVKRVKDALSDDLAKLNFTARDWAEWNDTYAFIEDRNQVYAKTNLNAPTIARLRLSQMLYVNSKGQTVFATGFHQTSQTLTPVSQNLQKHLYSKSLLLSHPTTDSIITGIIILPEGPMLVASRPILTGAGIGPVRGTLLMGRYLDSGVIRGLAERTYLSVTMYRADDAQMPPDFRAVSSSLSAKAPILVRPLDEQTVAGYTLLRDVYGQPAILMRVDSPRLIYEQGQASIRHLILSLLAVGLVFCVATLLLLEKLILSRLFRLSTEVRIIGTIGDLSARVLSIKGRDELSSLASTINGMLEALDHSQREQRNSEERYHRQNMVLADLAKRKTLDGGDLDASLWEITEAAAYTLEVARVSVWLYDDQRSKMQCIKVYERRTHQQLQNIEIVQASFPAYFKALEEERTIAAHNAHTDPRTQEFSQVYFSSLGIKSTLDAPIWLNGQIVGVVCHEHVGSTRQWSLEEQNFAGSIADLISLAMEACERKRSQSELQKAHNQLEIRIRQRTAELAKANEELQAEIIERKAAEEQLLHDAFHDGLTGLPNRALLADRLGLAIERAKRRPDYLFAVLFLDLDRFKVVNDSLGHLIGDQLLIAFVRRLEVCLRSTDTLARLGGDEFVILLEDIREISDATNIAQRIHNELTVPFTLNGHEVFITASIGIALSTISYERPEEVLRDADTVMYRAKAMGKARHEVFDRAMHARAVEMLQLENDLRRSLEYQELQIHYQPIVSVKTGQITGFEALTRWQHPRRGMVSPLEFVPMAEETGLIVPIGYWVLREACSEIRRWQERFAGNPPLTISVNFSAKQFSQPDLIKQINQILQETNLDASSLKLEITESVIMDNAESAADMLSQLKSLGVQLYIDDFGTGYSSLSYLQRFPIDALKIDRSFISRMGIDKGNLEIVRTIMTMAHNLNMDVVAEGVETDEQLAQLRELQCEYCQGYLFSKPLNREAAQALIDR